MVWVVEEGGVQVREVRSCGIRSYGGRRKWSESIGIAGGIPRKKRGEGHWCVVIGRARPFWREVGRKEQTNCGKRRARKEGIPRESVTRERLGGGRSTGGRTRVCEQKGAGELGKHSGLLIEGDVWFSWWRRR